MYTGQSDINCIGSCYKIDFSVPFITTKSNNNFRKSTFSDRIKEEKKIISDVNKKVTKRDRQEQEKEEGDIDNITIDPIIMDWYESFNKLGSRGSIGLVPKSFRPHYLSEKKIDFEKSDVAQTVQHFLTFWKANNK